MIVELRYTALRATDAYSGVYPPIIFRTFSPDASMWVHERKRQLIYYRDR